MNDLTTFNYETTAIRVQSSDSGEPLFCLADVCGVLEISNPSVTAAQIKEEFGTPKLNLGMITRPDGSSIEATFITEPQLYFVMYRTRSAKAKPFRRWVDSEVLPAIRKTGRYESDILRPQAAPQTQPEPTSIQLKDLLEVTKIVLEPAGIEGNQLTLALDKVVKSKTGESALALAGVQLKAPTNYQLLTPTEIGKQLGLGAREVNGYLAAMGYQARTAKGWELTDRGRAIGGVYLDVNKRNFNGAPIRQLKWPALVVERVHIFRDKQNVINTLTLLSD